MQRVLGILFVDSTEVLIRIYAVNQESFTLMFSHSLYLTPRNIPSLIENLATLLRSDKVMPVDKWIGLSREAPSHITQILTGSFGISIDMLSPAREQELICYGVLTQYSRRAKDMV